MFLRLVTILHLIPCLVAQDCLLSNATACPDIRNCSLTDTVVSQPGINYICTVNLYDFYKVVLTEGNYFNLTIRADRVTIGDISVQHDLIVLASIQFEFTKQAKVQAGRIMIANSRNANINLDGVYLQANKVVLYSSTVISIVDSIIVATQYTCTSQESLPVYPTEFLRVNYTKALEVSVTIVRANQSLITTISRISQNYTLGIYSYQTIKFNQSKVIGSFISLVGQSLTVDEGTHISSFGAGCKDIQGIGKGIRYNAATGNCNSSGASSSGYGSTDCQQSIQYFSFILHSYPYGAKLNPMVTGSAGVPVSEVDQSLGAGGIIMIRTSKMFSLNGRVDSSSSDALGSISSSAGSGGTVNIVVGNLSGTGQILANGGSALGLSGHGSGGWIKIMVLDNNSFLGRVVARSGESPDNSTATIYADYGNAILPVCEAGFVNPSRSSMECTRCDVSAYRSPLSPSCRQCSNNKNQLSDKPVKRKSSECFSLNPKRDWEHRSPRDFLVHYPVYRIAVLFGSLFVFVGVGFLLFKKFKKKKSILESQGFDFNKVITDLNQDNIITDSLKNQKQFKMGDLLYHVHRITVFGTNSSHSPWMISNKMPPQLSAFLIPDTFQDFTRTFNKKAKWTLVQSLLIYLSTLVYPLYWYLLIKIKKAKYKQVSKLMESPMLNFVQPEYNHGREVLKAKLSKSTDYTLCYIDVFNYYQADLKYFKLQFPYLVHLSGEGNFLRPFYLCEADPFLNSLFMVVNRNISARFIDDRFKIIDNLVGHAQRIENAAKLGEFVRYFNRASRTLDLAAPRHTFVEEVAKLVKYIHEWNAEFFLKKMVKISLVMMVTRFKRSRVRDHEISILENGNKVEFDRLIKDTLRTLQQTYSNDLKFALFIYNPQKDIVELVSSTQVQNEITPFDRHTTHNEQLSPKPKYVVDWKRKTVSLFELLRYLLISHKSSIGNKYTLRMFLALSVLLNGTIISIWEEEWIGIPYIFANIAAPFIGVIWLASGMSYGVGKMFLVLNALSIVNNLQFLASSLANWSMTSGFHKTIRLVLVSIQIVASLLGCQIITSSKKLNQSKIT